ncbi:MAG: SDR family NAD(P)-dependent oxidoreductase [Spirochaetes bacterium]|nr:SDR family NAD(P)-dependent oxidoreductase [Spirochaetota bacterium]
MDGQKNTALVTGACSGIGLAISGELASLGYPLLMVSNKEAALASAAGEIEAAYGVKPSVFCLDLAQRDSAEKLFNFCQSRGLKIEILVNNAGIFFYKDVASTPPEQMEAIINLHITTPALLMRLFAGQMIGENRKGHILNIASISSRMMMPGIALYSSTKSFLRCFSRAMRNEVFHKGVYITTLSPGAVATGLYDLPQANLKLGLKLGVIMPPKKLAKIAVKKMLRRKAEYIPAGFINRLFIFLVAATPEFFIRKLKIAVENRTETPKPPS